MTFTACPGPDGGSSGAPDSGPGRVAETVTYESQDGEDFYVLVITQNTTGRAAANSIAYVLTFYPSSGGKKATSGRLTSITSDRSRIILEADSVTITVTINSEDKMIALTWEGKITWDDSTETDAPATLEPVIEDEGLSISSDGVLTKYTGTKPNPTIPEQRYQHWGLGFCPYRPYQRNLCSGKQHNRR